MTLDELKAALQAADPAAVLVPGHLLARVIREVHDIGGQMLQVPHRTRCIIDRALLYRHIDADDLDIGPDRLLPPRVILLARPSLDRRNGLESEATLLRYWRRLFHASVHMHLERTVSEGRLGPEEVAARIDAIGQPEFAEIRNVLDAENYLFPKADDRDIYIEFAATYLEMRYFEPDLLPTYFPAIRNWERIDRLLVQDVDVEALFVRTRLAGVTEPAPRRDDSADEPTDVCLKLMQDARRAGRHGNVIRGTILRTRAARIAPAVVTARLRREIATDLDEFTNRLQQALKLSAAEAAEWRKDLPILVEKTGEELWSAEARLLYDLQSACLENEREVNALDVVDWVLSFGKRPIKRPLPNQRVVRILRHLRSAAARLAATRLSEADRQHLGRLLHEARHANEERLRGRFRPVLLNALHDVGLQATNIPERAGLHKMVEELLDRIIEYGFFTYSDLRDAISRNHLKLPDLTDPQELIHGDPLLQLDRLLAPALDGVYRPSEIYLNVLQRVTAAPFGTTLGRLFTRYVLLPIGGAAALLEGVDLILREGHNWFGDKANHVPLFGPLSVLDRHLVPSLPQSPFKLLAPVCLFLVSLLLFGLIHSSSFRTACRQLGRKAWRLGKYLVVDLPAGLLPIPWLKRVLSSGLVQFVWCLLLKPIPICALIWWIYPPALASWLRGLSIFFAIGIVINSRAGRTMEDAASRGVLQFLNWLSVDVFYGLIRLIARVFKRILDGLEYVLYTIDELLRFRTGESRASLVLRAVAGLLWAPIQWVLRLYIVVLVEPGFNPIKAPIAIVAAKFIYPITLTIELRDHVITGWLEQFVGSIAAQAITYPTLWLLPDAVGFLVWEMKENWKLYRANRPETLKPVSVGPHAETLLQLLKPGFHSGTVPKLYAQWRRAEREAPQSGAWRASRACREKMQRLEEAVHCFVQRDMLALLHQVPGWHKAPVRVGEVALASNMVRINFLDADHPGSVFRLAIAEESGVLVARVEELGWVPQLPAERLATLTWGVTGLYKLAGVNVVQEQLQVDLPPGTTWRIAEHGLVLRSPGQSEQRVFDFHEMAVPEEGDSAALLPSLPLIFALWPVTWESWVAGWEGERGSRVVGAPPVPVLPGAPAGADEGIPEPPREVGGRVAPATPSGEAGPPLGDEPLTPLKEDGSEVKGSITPA